MATTTHNDLTASLTVSPTNTMEGQVNILGRVKNTMTAQYQIMPDLPALLKVSPTNIMSGQVNIEPPPSETKELEAVMDAMLREARPTLNYGTTATISVGYKLSEDGRYRGLFRFDLSSIPTDVTIDKAYLRLRTPGDHAVAQDIEVYGVKESWVETGVTWKSHPEIDFSPLDTKTVEPGAECVELDITNIVADWYQGTRENHGLLVKASPETRDQLIRFYAREYGNSAYSPTLVVTYLLPAKAESSWLSGSLEVYRPYELGSDDIEANLNVFQNLAEDDLPASFTIVGEEAADFSGSLGVARPDQSSSLTVPHHDDLTSSLAVRVTEERGLNASVVVSKPDIPSKLGVTHHDDLTTSLSVRKTLAEDLEATLAVRQSTNNDLSVSINVVNGPNDLAGHIRVLSGFLASNLYIAHTEDFPGSLEVPLHPGSKYLRASITARTTGNGDLGASISVINGPNDLPASIQVASGNLASELDVKVFDEIDATLGVSDYDDLDASLTVRQRESADFTGTLSTFGGPNDLTATLRVISDWMRASILVVHSDSENLEMHLTARQKDISELTSTMIVGEPSSDLPGTISVEDYEILPATLTVEQFNTHHVDGQITVRQTEPGDLEASLAVTEPEDLPATISVGEPTAADLAASLYVMRPEILPGWLIVHKGWDLLSSLTVAEHASLAATITVKRHRNIPGYLAVRRSNVDDMVASLTVSRPEADGKVVVSRGSQPGIITVRQTAADDLTATLQVSQVNMDSGLAVTRRSLTGSITVEGAYHNADLRTTLTVESWQGFVDELYDLLPPVLKIDPKVINNDG